MSMINRAKIFAIFLFFANDPSAMAQSFIYQGVNQIADSGASLVNVIDASSAASNPASLSGIEMTTSYADISALAVRYTYAHTNYDPVTIVTKAPPVNLGANIYTGRKINLGILVSPRSAPGAKPMDVSDVPTFTGAGYALYDLKIKQTGMLAAIGAGGRIGESPLSVGAAVIYGSDGQEITAYADEGDHSTPAMDLKYSGESYQGVVGVRVDWNDSVLGFSFKTASERHYKGDIASTASDNVYEVYRGVSYQPATAGIGFESRIGSVAGMAEINREFWSRGRSVANRGLPYASPATDFVDAYSSVLALRYHHQASRTFSLSAGFYSANTGDGSMSSSPATNLAQSEIPAESGMEFGQFEAIPRYVLGGGIKQRFVNRSGYWMISGNYQTGTRTIPEGHKGEGWYHLEVYTLSAGLASSF